MLLIHDAIVLKGLRRIKYNAGF